MYLPEHERVNMLVKYRVFSLLNGRVGYPVFQAAVYATACGYLAAFANWEILEP